jgi:hypothetical protein
MKKLLKKLFRCADNHGADASKPENTVVDLQDLLRAAWALMTPVQQRKLLQSEEVEELVEAGARDEFSANDLIDEHAAYTNVEIRQVVEGYTHSDLAMVVHYLDNKEQTIHRASIENAAGEVRESPYAIAAGFIRSVVEAQLQKTPAFWYSIQHGEPKLSHDYMYRDGAYTWHPLFTGVNADVQTFCLPADWPTSEMIDAFADALPKHQRDDGGAANLVGRPKLVDLFSGDNFKLALRACFSAAPVLGPAKKDGQYLTIRSAVTQILRDVDTVDDAGALADKITAAVTGARTSQGQSA